MTIRQVTPLTGSALLRSRSMPTARTLLPALSLVLAAGASACSADPSPAATRTIASTTPIVPPPAATATPSGEAPPGAKLVIDDGSGLRFAVTDRAVVIQGKKPGTLGKVAPQSIANLKSKGATPYLVDTISAASVAAIDPATGTVVTLSKLQPAQRLPSDQVLNASARKAGAISPGIVHRTTDFRDTGTQDYGVPTPGTAQVVRAVRVYVINAGHLWALTAIGSPKDIDAASQLATETLTARP